jgi:hypothetical protein
MKPYNKNQRPWQYRYMMMMMPRQFVGGLCLLSLLLSLSSIRTEAFATKLEAAAGRRTLVPGSPDHVRSRRLNTCNVRTQASAGRTSLLVPRGGGASNNEAEIIMKDCKGEAAGLFGNIRIPAALFAGASAGAAFALPVAMGSESLKLGLVKRIYALLMMSALSSQVVAVVVSTLVLSTLSTSSSLPLAPSLTDFLQSNFELEFIAVRWHFLSGILCFLIGIGLRAWITIACPIIAKAALGIIVSSALLCIAFVQDSEASASTWLDGFFQLPFQYTSLLAKRSVASFKRSNQKMINPLFTLAMMGTTWTTLYIIGKGPHIIRWLANAAP